MAGVESRSEPGAFQSCSVSFSLVDFLPPQANRGCAKRRFEYGFGLRGHRNSLVCSRRALSSTATRSRFAAVLNLWRLLLSLGKTSCPDHSFSVRVSRLSHSLWRCRTSHVSAAIRHHVGNRVFEQTGRTSDRRGGNNAHRHRRKV